MQNDRDTYQQVPALKKKILKKKLQETLRISWSNRAVVKESRKMAIWEFKLWMSLIRISSLSHFSGEQNLALSCH